MIDTHARKYFQPFFERLARIPIYLELSPSWLTLLAFISGAAASLCFFLDLRLFSAALLFVSGLLDILDGSVARMTGTGTPWGAFLDLVLDRVVEVVFIITVALALPDTRLSCILLLGSIIFSFTIFLLSGSLIRKNTEKAFYYQAGLAERTETFIVFAAVLFMPSYASQVFSLFAAMIVFTGCQRFLEVYLYLFGKGKC